MERFSVTVAGLWYGLAEHTTILAFPIFFLSFLNIYPIFAVMKQTSIENVFRICFHAVPELS
ncbi:MAG: hypothetical protein LBJ23_03000, partial [Tannerella sp.]|nr:hypothetical protein [Tannerella sp.]